MNQRNELDLRPPVDTEVPSELQTLTFALG